MANKIKGITVEIGGDTKGLSKALTDVNKEIKSTTSQLKDVERLLKLDPTNTNLLQQRQKLLAQAVKETSDKLSALKQASEQAASTKDNYDAYIQKFTPIKNEIDQTDKALADLKKQMEEVAKEDGPESEKYKELESQAAETEDKIKDLRKQGKECREEFGNPVSPEQWDGLQREIIDTEQQLKHLKEECKDFGNVFSQQMKAASEKVQEAGDKISNVGEKVTDVGKKMLPVTAAISGLGVVTFNAASDMAESQNKVETAFGSSADRILKFADTTLDAYGIAKGTSLDMAALFGDMATSMDIPERKAAEMSATLVGLAGDLSSYKNISLDTASSALKSIFTGETESLKSLGVVMTQDNLLRYAMQNGMIDTAKTAAQLEKEELALEKAQVAYNNAVKKHGINSLEAREAALKISDAEAKLNEDRKASLDSLSQQEMVQLRYSYVLNATKNAQGDFARTSDGAANSVRIMQESVKEAAAELGEVLLPIITPIIQKITEAIKWLATLDDGQKKAIVTIAAVIAAIGPLLMIIGKVVSITGSVVTGIGQVGQAMSFIAANPIVLLIGAIVALVALIATKGDEIQALLQKVDDFLQGVFATDWTTIFGPVLGEVLNGFFANLKNIWDSVKQVFDGVIDFVRGVFTGDWERAWNGVKEIFGGIFSGLVGLAKAPINAIIGFINSAIGALNMLISGLNRIPGVNIGQIGTIPLLASGGTVLRGSAIVGEAGPELLTVAGGKTVVQPLTNNNTTNNATNLGGVNITVYGAPGQDVHELANILMDEFQYVCDKREAGIHG